MWDSISREAAIKLILSGRVGDDSLVECPEECNSMLEWAAAEVAKMPTAEKVAKWITKHPYRDDFGKVQLDLRFRYPSCSNCGAVFGCKPYYCPNCGWKMKNGTEWLDWDAGYGVQEGEDDDPD